MKPSHHIFLSVWVYWYPENLRFSCALSESTRPPWSQMLPPLWQGCPKFFHVDGNSFLDLLQIMHSSIISSGQSIFYSSQCALSDCKEDNTKPLLSIFISHGYSQFSSLKKKSRLAFYHSKLICFIPDHAIYCGIYAWSRETEEGIFCASKSFTFVRHY